MGGAQRDTAVGNIMTDEEEKKKNEKEGRPAEFLVYPESAYGKPDRQSMTQHVDTRTSV